MYLNLNDLKGSDPVRIASIVAYISLAVLHGAPAEELCLIAVANHKLRPSTMLAADNWSFI